MADAYRQSQGDIPADIDAPAQPRAKRQMNARRGELLERLHALANRPEGVTAVEFRELAARQYSASSAAGYACSRARQLGLVAVKIPRLGGGNVAVRYFATREAADAFALTQRDRAAQIEAQRQAAFAGRIERRREAECARRRRQREKKKAEQAAVRAEQQRLAEKTAAPSQKKALPMHMLRPANPDAWRGPVTPIAGFQDHDARFQVPPGTHVVGGFETAGIGRYDAPPSPWVAALCARPGKGGSHAR